MLARNLLTLNHETQHFKQRKTPWQQLLRSNPMNYTTFQNEMKASYKDSLAELRAHAEATMVDELRTTVAYRRALLDAVRATDDNVVPFPGRR
jgi:hypothetical protein